MLAMTLYTPLLYAFQIAHQQIAFVVAQVHTATSAELPHLTLLALIGLGPLAVAEGLKSILPHIPETIAVDVALGIVASHACASRNVAIDTNRCHRNARIAHIEVVAHLRLVAAEKALAGVAEVYASLLA